MGVVLGVAAVFALAWFLIVARRVGQGRYDRSPRRNGSGDGGGGGWSGGGDSGHSCGGGGGCGGGN
ncbi:hypothetical protein [Streptomyces sp. NPDC058953]|uniref:hypothetical protein n=1 Tax=unclassified Streptomyces TaxID=2593676 RepID=UPI003687B434